MKKLKAVTALLLTIAIAAVFSGCSDISIGKSEYTKYTDVYFDYFDTMITLVAYCKSSEEFEALSSRTEELFCTYSRLFDIYNTYRDINNAKTINDNAGISAVKADPVLTDLILYSKELYGKTEGNVNIAFGSVLKLWHEARENAESNPENTYIPGMEELKDAALHCNIDYVIADSSACTVYLADPEMSLDLGAVAKGYATELTADTLEAEGHTGIIISAGGNTRSIGTKPDGSPWIVAIQNPDTSSSEYAEVIQVADKSVVTSGTYERYFEYESTRYHHIINKDSLMPENNYLSVTIVTEDSGYADALSTAVFNMDFDKGLAFVEGLENTEAMWIFNDYTKAYSSGFKDFLKE